MKEFLNTYLLYIKTFFKAKAEYKVSFLFGFLANFYCYFITFITYWIITKGAGIIDGWVFEELSLLYGMSLLTYSIAGTMMWYSVYHLGEIITMGQLDVMLVRPEGIIRQMIFQRFGDTFLGQIAVTIIFVISAFLSQSIALSIGKIIYMFLCVISGVLIQMGSMIMFGAVSFWTMRSDQLIGMLYYDLRDMTKFPLSIYPAKLKLILTFVLPWAFINYYPVLVFLDKSTSVMDTMLGYLAPCVGIIWFALGNFVFRCGLKKYSGAGN